ncbi:hypothetical protein NDU88_002457 [Pleurodeles waltl]|uniref:Uncharacterized protein n=1 Tax=Pleurodeles waltl TaxID=8319 RepID=A0AAV7T256_PLEWA|nr:hypothetical protein NDU88_002457 [Pleurodeles waltl]
MVALRAQLNLSGRRMRTLPFMEQLPVLHGGRVAAQVRRWLEAQQKRGVPAAVGERRRPGNQTAPEAGTALRPRPPSERHTDPARDRRANGILTPAGGARPGLPEPRLVAPRHPARPRGGAQRATARVVAAPRMGDSGADGSVDQRTRHRETRAARPQKVGGIEGRALEIRAL